MGGSVRERDGTNRLKHGFVLISVSCMVLQKFPIQLFKERRRRKKEVDIGFTHNDGVRASCVEMKSNEGSL